MRRRLVVALLTVLAVGLGSPTGAGALIKAIWGPPNAFSTYKQLGVGIYETDLDWAEIAPTRPRHPTNPRDPAYHWPSDLDEAVANAKASGIRVMLEAITAPRWANGGHSAMWAPRRPGDFANFLRAAAKRYPTVHLWMIWGEPDRAGEFQPFEPASPSDFLDAAQQRAPHFYARMLDASYGALKAASHSNLVIGGCTFTAGYVTPEQWVANLRLPNGRPPRMDLYAHNPFGFRAPDFSAPASPFGHVDFSDLQRFAHVIDHYLRPGLPLFISEYTIPTAPDQEFNFSVDPPLQAEWITDALRLARAWKRIYALGWVHLQDDPPATNGGLLYANGTPKPGFAAFEHG